MGRIGSGRFREISGIIPRPRKNAANSGMILTGYKAKFRDSGRFMVRKVEAADQVAPGDLKNEGRGGDLLAGKDAGKWI